MATVMAAVADDGLSVVLSSHILADLERVATTSCSSRTATSSWSGEVDDLLAEHRMLTGPASEYERYAKNWNVVHASQRRVAGSPSGPLRQHLRSGATGMGGTARHPGRTELLPICVSPTPRHCHGRSRGRWHESIGVGEMTALTVSFSPAAGSGVCDHCLGTEWAGSSGGITGSRWPAWWPSSEHWRCGCGSRAFRCTTSTPLRSPAIRRLGGLLQPDHHFRDHEHVF